METLKKVTLSNGITTQYSYNCDKLTIGILSTFLGGSTLIKANVIFSLKIDVSGFFGEQVILGP